MKRFKEMQVWLIALAFLGTAALLFGGQVLQKSLRVTQPLKETVLSRDEVKNIEVIPLAKSEGVKVKLELNQTADLQDTLEFVRDQVELYHGKRVTAWELGGKSNDRLKELRYELSFYLEEAQTSGHYRQLKEELDSFEAVGVTARIYLTESFIYLQLEEEGNFLYQALPRKNSLVVAVNDTDWGGDG